MAIIDIAAATCARQPPWCGDQARWWKTGDAYLLSLVDGLGHGKNAAQVAELALGLVEDRRNQTLEDIFTGCDAALRDSRGAAMALAVVEEGLHRLSYAAVGAIRAMAVLAGRNVRLPATPGIVGGGYKKLKVQTLAFAGGDTLIVSTDGLARSINAAACIVVAGGDAQALADRILNRFASGSDDAAVVVMQKTAKQ